VSIEGGLVSVSLHDDEFFASVLAWLEEFDDAPAETVGVTGFDGSRVFLEGLEDNLLLASNWSDQEHGGDLVCGVLHGRHFDLKVG